MQTNDDWTPGHLRELTEDECRDLATQTRLGRFAWCSPDGPVVLPVNFRFDGETVVFRTSAHTELARQFKPGPAAFEIDEYDEYTQSGWSVLIRGRAEVVENYELPEPDERPQPWVEGSRAFYIRLDVTRMTGRRVLGS